ncbi:MAG: hypothetical protein K6A28_08195 [Bacteroidales bacterium]|nr:hypothetical protein [Bacteroidales bacterium]
MKLEKWILMVASCLTFCLLTCEISAQSLSLEKRIYLFDVSQSTTRSNRAGVFEEMKKTVGEAMNDIIDPRTEVVIIPFADRPVSDKDVIEGTMAKKDSLLMQVESLKPRPGNTNLADAWMKGLDYLDATKLNYLFVLAAGTQNAGPDQETLYDRLRAWDTISEGKPYYAFYVMVDDKAIDPEIQLAAEETRQMWAIESMNANPILFTTPNVQYHNVFEDKTVGVPFTSNNMKASLEDLDLRFVVDDNPYYNITETRQNENDPRVFEFKVLEVVDRINIPLNVDLNVQVRNDDKKHPDVFFIPEELSLKIYNRGVRRMTVNAEKEPAGIIDFGKGTYREPFVGLLSSHPRWIASTLDWPLIRSLKPDSLALEKNIEIGFNEDAVRCNAEATLQFVDNDFDVLKGVQVYCDGVRVGTEGYAIKATSTPQIINVVFKIDPVRKGGTHSGQLLVTGVEVDEANNVKLFSEGPHSILDWKYTYKRGVALLLWMTWLLLIVVLPLLLITTAVLLFKRRAFLKGHPFLTKNDSFVHECHSSLGKFFQNKIESVILLNDVRSDIDILKATDQPSSKKAEALWNLHGQVEQMKELNPKLYKEQILILMNWKIKKALRKFHGMVWKQTPYEGIGGHWERSANGVKYVLSPRNLYYKACEEAGMTECEYGSSGEPDFDLVTEEGTVVDCTDLYDADLGDDFMDKVEERIANNKRQELAASWKNRHPEQEFDLHKAYEELKSTKRLVLHEDANCKTSRLVYQPAHEAFGSCSGLERVRLVKRYF